LPGACDTRLHPSPLLAYFCPYIGIFFGATFSSYFPLLFLLTALSAYYKRI
jgi:hypothetical protein